MREFLDSNRHKSRHIWPCGISWYVKKNTKTTFIFVWNCMNLPPMFATWATAISTIKKTLKIRKIRKIHAKCWKMLKNVWECWKQWKYTRLESTVNSDIEIFKLDHLRSQKQWFSSVCLCMAFRAKNETKMQKKDAKTRACVDAVNNNKAL